MSQSLEEVAPTVQAWCGRSWAGLVDRRYAAFAQALSLRDATQGESRRVVGDFLRFFEETGVGLMRDEEEWIFRSLRPTPAVVIEALRQHIEISTLIQSLLDEVQAGCVDLRLVRHLGEVLESHLLMEEEEIRPLIEPPRRRLSVAR